MRVVVKIGTSLIAPDGQIDFTWMRSLIDQLVLVECSPWKSSAGQRSWD
jgi:glutamate 5-kinase